MFDFKLAWNKATFTNLFMYCVVKRSIRFVRDVTSFKLQICTAREHGIRLVTLGSHVTGQPVGHPYLQRNFGPVLGPV